MNKPVLIVVDVQHDFTAKEGKAYVKGSEKIIPAINTLIDVFHKNGHLVVFTRDWHPRNHTSFNKVGEHCVANSSGALLDKDIKLPVGNCLVLNKGTSHKEQGLSAFEATDGYFALDHFLQQEGIEEVFVSGLTLEGSVSATATDSVGVGYNTYVVSNAVKAGSPAGKAKTLRTFEVNGIETVNTKRACTLIAGALTS